MYDLYGKTVVLTGVTGGFGGEIAKILINEYNCRVIGIGRSREKMIRFCRSLGKKMANFKFFLLDVSEKSEWQRLFARIEKNGIRVQVLINCAGQLPPFGRFENTDSDKVQAVMNVNFMSAVYGCEVFLPMLKAQKGCIVNVSSSAAFSPLAGTCAYSASKAALADFTRALAQEEDIFVSLVCPGFSKTDIMRHQKQDGHPLIDLISTDKSVIARRIVNGVQLGVPLMFPSVDAVCMTAFSNICPAFSGKVYKGVLSALKTGLFSDVFGKEDKK